MNINSHTRTFIYFAVLLLLAYLLYKEYSYIHPYNTGFYILGPKWTYTSTATITWWFLLICSSILTTPLIKKQKIGFWGLILLFAVVLRPIVQIKFPEETAKEFYTERKDEFKKVVNQYQNVSTDTIETAEIKKLGFERLVIRDSVFYFLIVDEEFPIGICYSKLDSLPEKQFYDRLKYQKIEGYWYEFDY